MDSASVLQHPRRNLGSRHRSQADRFVKLAKQDPSRESENLAWAEQNAQQAVLFDFTDERNWRCLAIVKKMRNDGEKHPIESVGDKLRSMMPWISANKLVDKNKN